MQSNSSVIWLTDNRWFESVGTSRQLYSERLGVRTIYPASMTGVDSPLAVMTFSLDGEVMYWNNDLL